MNVYKHHKKINLMQGRKSKIVDSIKLKVAAKMEDVTVKLENDIREITALEVSFSFYKHIKQDLFS